MCAGCACDFISVKHCNAVGVRWALKGAREGDFEEHCEHFRGKFEGCKRQRIQANLDFLKNGRLSERGYDQERIEAVLEMLLSALRAMCGHAALKPLCAACSRLLCRPWILVALREMLA